ncbi:MAG: hypothetical protein JWM74_3787 [Myxococcaceae bacterium]|nr:hypothetical protein [Myxococcaceae bacterium]
MHHILAARVASFASARLSRVLAILVLAAIAITFSPGCSGSACSDSDCSAGNKCVDDGKTGSKCRLVCADQSTCPFNYACAATADKKTSFCAETGIKYTKKAKGQWGATCKPSGGLDANPDCDADQSFWCYGENPTDADSYCTQFQCAKDSDCAGGYWCATINNAPAVYTTQRSYGAENTTTVCLKRSYCSTCTADIDCPSLNGTKSHCITGADKNRFCSNECEADGSCRVDATCVDNAESGAKLCYPRAGTCKGDGKLCSPCRSDADCPEGICADRLYEHERFCTVHSKVPCSVANGKSTADCPAESPAGVKISCITTKDFPGVPKDECTGIVDFGRGTDAVSLPGCWVVAGRVR